MDYFITVDEESIKKIGDAVEKPITVIDGLKEDIADLEETVAQKDETIAAKDLIIEQKDARIEELEASVMTQIQIRILANNTTGSVISGQAPTFAERSTGSIIPPSLGVSSYSIPANSSTNVEVVQTAMLLKNGTGVINLGTKFSSYSVDVATNCSANISAGSITISNVVDVNTRCVISLAHN